jgi:hypothetical protein
MDPARADETASLVDDGLDWEAVLFFARLHSVASLLQLHVKEAPERVRLRLLELTHRTAYRNRLFRTEHVRLAAAFDEAGIPFIVQKGLSVVELLYGNLQLRPLIDLVYFVPPEHVASAAKALQSRDYAERMPAPAEGIYRWCCPQRFFVREAEMRVALLLQWSLVNWPRLHRWEMPEVWLSARPAELGGRPCLVLSPTDLVIYLCLQADNNGFFNRVAGGTDRALLVFGEWTNNRLVRFVDIHQAIERLSAEISWDEVVEKATATNTAEAVYTSLDLTGELLGSPVGDGVLDRLRWAPSRRLRRWVFLSVAAERSGGASGFVRTIWRRATVRRRLRSMYLVSLVEFAFPTAEQLSAHYEISSRWACRVAAIRHALRVTIRSVVVFGVLMTGKAVGRLGFRTRPTSASWTILRSPPAR